MHRHGDIVQRDTLRDDVRDESTAAAAARWWGAVDCARPGLEVDAVHHVRLDLRIKADHLHVRRSAPESEKWQWLEDDAP